MLFFSLKNFGLRKQKKIKSSNFEFLHKILNFSPLWGARLGEVKGQARFGEVKGQARFGEVKGQARLV